MTYQSEALELHSSEPGDLVALEQAELQVVVAAEEVKATVVV